MPGQVVLAETVLEFEYVSAFDAYAHVLDSLPFEFIAGHQYTITWDGVAYTRTAFAFSAADGSSCIAVGNPLAAGESSNGDPFAIVCERTNSYLYLISTEASDTHAVSILLTEGIVLKDRNGDPVAYYGIETVTFDTTTEGTQQTYTKGTAVEGLEIVPDFSGGDMSVVAPEGTLVKSAAIKKPENLAPENVRNGVEIGGILGTDIGDTEEQTLPLTMADGDMVIEPSDVGKVMSKVTIQKPETLVPENIAEGVDIGGLVGTHKGGEFENSIRYYSCVVDPPQGVITLQSFNYNAVYQDTGNPAVSIRVPGKFGPYPVSIVSGSYSYGFFNHRNIIHAEIDPNVQYVNNSMFKLFGGCSNFNTPVTIPQGITNIAQLFNNCKMFNQQVNIPNGVTNVAETFYMCSNFNQPVELPNTVTAMIGTFRSCSVFNQPVVIPNSVKMLPYAFTSCSNFNHPVTIPHSVNNVNGAFEYCSRLNSPITFESGENVNFGAGGLSSMFAQCFNFNLPVTIPDHIVGTLNNTFAYCNNLNAPIVIGNGIDALIRTFNGCSKLRSNITIGTGVTNMTYAFYNAHYAGNVTILSSNVTNMLYAFYSDLTATRNTRLNIYAPAGSTTLTKLMANGTYIRTGSNLVWSTNANNGCRYNSYYNVYIYEI